MSAPTLPQILDALDTRLATIPGLRHSAYIADQLDPPHAAVFVPDIDDYRATFNRGKVELTYKIHLYVSAALDRVGQKKLAEFASWTGTNSIPLAIEADRVQGTSALAGLVDDCVVDSFRSFGLEEVGLIGYYGGEFTGRIIANGV